MHSFEKVSVRIDFYIMIVLSLLILPVQWFFGWLIAAGLHELFHILMIRFLKIKIQTISIGTSGAIISTELMTPFQEFLCALAGPIGGLLALFLLRAAPTIAVSAVIQSVYNLLPVYPLDGGRAAKSLIVCMWGEMPGERISRILTYITISLSIAIGVWLCYSFQLGIVPLLFPSVPLIFSVYKNSLQSTKNNSTISAYLPNSERTIHK